jgi:hypothetical protein
LWKVGAGKGTNGEKEGISGPQTLLTIPITAVFALAFFEFLTSLMFCILEYICFSSQNSVKGLLFDLNTTLVAIFKFLKKRAYMLALTDKFSKQRVRED